MTRKDVHWNFGLALTETGVVRHQWVGPGDGPPKTAQYAVVRDEAAKTTRYELRLPLADLGLEPGLECSSYAIAFDDDGKQPPPHRLQWAPPNLSSFRRERYPRFVLEE